MFLLTSSILALATLCDAQVSPSGTPTTQTNSSDALVNVAMAFTQEQVVPDVLPTFNPKIAVQPIFSDSVTSEEVDVVPDVLLSEQQVHNPPGWFLASNTSDLSQSNTSWVITILDPDALTPQNPNISQFLHYIGKDFVVDPLGVAPSGAGALPNLTALMNTTEALVEFFPPSPPATSDPHRYVCLVYVQPDDFAQAGLTYFNGSIPTNTTSFRDSFNVTDFAANTNMGDPVAGNFFLVGANVNITAPTTSPTPTPIPDTSAFPFPTPSPTPLTTIVETTETPVSTEIVQPSASTTSGAVKVVGQLPSVILMGLGVILGMAVQGT